MDGLHELESYGEPGAMVYLANCVELMRLMPPACVDVVFADPPYRLSSGGVTVKSGRVTSVDKGSGIARWAAGDFTSVVADLNPGTTVYLDGPHGAFTINCHEGPGLVFICASVGVTLLISMLGTLTHRGDAGPLLPVPLQPRLGASLPTKRSRS